jgi:hypothetical protein
MNSTYNLKRHIWTDGRGQDDWKIGILKREIVVECESELESEIWNWIMILHPRKESIIAITYSNSKSSMNLYWFEKERWSHRIGDDEISLQSQKNTFLTIDLKIWYLISETLSRIGFVSSWAMARLKITKLCFQFILGLTDLYLKHMIAMNFNPSAKRILRVNLFMIWFERDVRQPILWSFDGNHFPRSMKSLM